MHNLHNKNRGTFSLKLHSGQRLHLRPGVNKVEDKEFKLFEKLIAKHADIEELQELHDVAEAKKPEPKHEPKAEPMPEVVEEAKPELELAPMPEVVNVATEVQHEAESKKAKKRKAQEVNLNE